jgi:hypothetical protein
MRVALTGDVPDSPALTVLEREILSRAFAGAGHGLARLRDQLAGAEVVSRTASGVGFLTKFRVPASLPAAVPAPSIPAVRGRHPMLPGGAEFLVELRDGRLHCLEAFALSGMWPPDETGFSLSAGA